VGALAPFQEGTGTFISCSFGSSRWHPSSITWSSSADMKTLQTKHTSSISLINSSAWAGSSISASRKRHQSPQGTTLGTKLGHYTLAMKVEA